MGRPHQLAARALGWVNYRDSGNKAVQIGMHGGVRPHAPLSALFFYSLASEEKNQFSMRTLVEINHTPGLNPGGRAATREAARGIILRGDRLLLIYSTSNGDYKFPGGGIQDGETHAAALRRELREECGVSEVRILRPFGMAVEYNRSIETEYDIFRMTSYYYLCEIGEARVALQLDRYEQELGFTPVWVEVEQAIQANAALLQDEQRRPPPWTRRDLAVLERVKLELII
jgi:8-oxo-dGTP diphosphatase